jgi:ADP-heptose:LPS heptosyltransferase
MVVHPLTPTAEQRLILFPGALGDLLCCWPALDALGAHGLALTVAARPALVDALPAGAVTTWSIDRREVAELFGVGPLSAGIRALFAGFAAVDSFTGHGDPHFVARLAQAATAIVRVHPFRAMQPGETARDYYARCLAVTPLLRPLALRPDAVAWANALWQQARLGQRALVIHPGSGSPAKNWQGMEAVAQRWRDSGGRVIALRGPAEIERGARLVARDLELDGEPLSHVAAVLARADRYLGNDSGISHLAGLVGAHAVVLFGDSDRRVWAPVGDGVRVLQAAARCARCTPTDLCLHRLSIDDVMAALD